jgi:hypothetical protein
MLLKLSENKGDGKQAVLQDVYYIQKGSRPHQVQLAALRCEPT